MMLCIVSCPTARRAVDDDVARLHVRVGEELVDVVDRRGGDLGGGEERHVFVQGARPIKATIGASLSSAFFTRSVLLRKRGSGSMSSWPMARNRRSDIAWIEAEMPI